MIMSCKIAIRTTNLLFFITRLIFLKRKYLFNKIRATRTAAKYYFRIYRERLSENLRKVWRYQRSKWKNDSHYNGDNENW